MTTRVSIDWRILADAIAYYESLGYEYVETPWVVPLDVLRITFDGNHLETGDGRGLVGSAEQGFLALDLPLGRYVSCSPCFRGDEPDELHHSDFMKVELFVTSSSSTVESVISDAKNLLSRYCSCEVVETQEGFDIECGGVELGSYGERKQNNFRWVYGTGVALPRLSQAVAKEKRSPK
jgi:hypothetical protein